MLRIKLSRMGKKKAPMYRLTIAEQARDPYGRALEILGSYNPFSKDLQVKADRIKYWLSQGATMTDSVNNLLINHHIIEGEKVKSYKITKKRAAKMASQKAEKETAEAQPESAPAADTQAEAAPAADSAPTEEAKQEAPAVEVNAEAQTEEAKPEEPQAATATAEAKTADQ